MKVYSWDSTWIKKGYEFLVLVFLSNPELLNQICICFATKVRICELNDVTNDFRAFHRKNWFCDDISKCSLVTKEKQMLFIILLSALVILYSSLVPFLFQHFQFACLRMLASFFLISFHSIKLISIAMLLFFHFILKLL